MAYMAYFALNPRQGNNSGGEKTWAYDVAQLTRSLKFLNDVGTK
jgi:hypothetical protein